MIAALSVWTSQKVLANSRRKDDVEKTTFVTPDGHYELLRMPFGMKKSGATLCRCMDKLLADCSNADNYVDDILVHTQTWDLHRAVLRKVFGRLAEARFTVRPSKCLVGSDTVNFLGQGISQEVRTPLWDGVSKVRNAQMPNSKRGLRSFLGLTGFHRDQIPNYAAIAVPLTNLLRKGQPNKLSWGEAQVRAYETLKGAVT